MNKIRVWDKREQTMEYLEDLNYSKVAKYKSNKNYEVMSPTSKKDERGNLIWEKDYINYSTYSRSQNTGFLHVNEYISIVIYNFDRGLFMIQRKRPTNNQRMTKDTIPLNDCFSEGPTQKKEVEIIGNWFENPEISCSHRYTKGE